MRIDPKCRDQKCIFAKKKKKKNQEYNYEGEKSREFFLKKEEVLC